MSASEVICVLLPLRIVSVANVRECWQAKAARSKRHRECAAWGMSKHNPPTGQITVTLTRIGVRALDSDNLASAFKATRDGVADWLGLDDADPRVTWAYAQRRGKPHEYAAEVLVTGAAHG